MGTVIAKTLERMCDERVGRGGGDSVADVETAIAASVRGIGFRTSADERRRLSIAGAAATLSAHG
jgi:hypothetical protein